MTKGKNRRFFPVARFPVCFFAARPNRGRAAGNLRSDPDSFPKKFKKRQKQNFASLPFGLGYIMAENGRMGKGKFRIISLYFNIFVIVWEKMYVTIMTTLGHVLIAYTPVGLYAGSLSRPRLTPETSLVSAYSKFGDRNFAPTEQRGRRDIAAYAARTRLSLL